MHFQKIAAVLAVLAFVVFVWPTPFTYHNAGSKLYRVNRFTGTADLVANGGNLPLAPSSSQYR